VRRADGQVVQLPQLLYLVAEEIDGRRGYDDISRRVSERFGRGLSAENVEFLVDEKLRPLGVAAAADGSSPELKKLDPLLALKFRAALVAEGVVNAITTVFRPLFLPPVVVAVLGGLVALDVWLFFVHGIAQSLRQVLYDPAFVLLLLGLVVLSAAFHECGHATACRYGGARPGAMGAGIYIVWPAFYTDVTDAYRLGKAGRLRTDLGGVYFNVIFILATAGAYALTGFEPLLLVIPLQHLEILHQFLPFLRLDGYYIVSDLTGVPDMFARIKPTLASLLPWRETDERVAELKTWVRGAVTAYVLTVIPALVFMFGLMVLNMPRIFATAWDSFFVQLHKVEHASSAVTMGVGGVQMAILVLPSLGIVVTLARTARRSLGAAWTHTAGRPVARAALALALVASAAFAAFIWWPNGDYRPIQPGEKGTLQGAVEQLAAVPTGRPALTKARLRELGGAPLASAKGGDTIPRSQTPVPEPQQSTPEATTSESTTVVETTPSGETTTVATTTVSSSTAETTTAGATATTVSTPTATETVQTTVTAP
jgi:putative peptide zinc metalloprotease protein